MAFDPTNCDNVFSRSAFRELKKKISYEFKPVLHGFTFTKAQADDLFNYLHKVADRSVHFQNCDFGDLVLEVDSLSAAQFDNCRLTGTAFHVRSHERVPKQTSYFIECDMRHCRIYDARNPNYSFSGCDMEHAYAGISLGRYTEFERITGQVGISVAFLKFGFRYITSIPGNPWFMHFTPTHMSAGCQWRTIEDWKSLTSDQLDAIAGEGAVKLARIARKSALTLLKLCPPRAIGENGHLRIY